MKYSILCLLLTCASHLAQALDVDLNSPASIKDAAKLIAKNLLSYYKGDQPGQIPGILPGPPPIGPYYWWLAGAMWGTMVDYWHYTNDTTYNNMTESSMVFQAGAPANSYMPDNWTASLGNDDQGFWGMSAMLAAETNFQNPPPTDPQWLALAQAVFNTQVPRWDPATCNGGMSWQAILANPGFDYKNTIANGIFFNLGARLARYTGNATYAEWAVKAYEWCQNVGYIDKDFNIYDGGHDYANCTDINRVQYSYTAAVFIQGVAFMHSYTNGSAVWEERLLGLTNRTLEFFFPGGIHVEVACELPELIKCNTDMQSFKGYAHRFMSQATQVAPIIHDPIMKVLRTSAQAAVKACNPDGTCGFRWSTGAYDGMTGVGEEMNALGALLSMLVDERDIASPYTNGTGGTSQGDPNAGRDPEEFDRFKPPTAGAKAGAGILTAFILAALVAFIVWMSVGK